MAYGEVRRITAVVSVILALVMIGVPTSLFGGGIDPIGSAAAADVERNFIVGVIDMTVSTLNPNTYTMVAEAMVIFPCYSTLIQWNVDGTEIIGDIAYDWTTSPDGLTWEFELVDNAYFIDPRSPDDLSNQVTSEDVKWTIDTLASNTRSRLHSSWPEGSIESTWTTGPYHFGLTLTKPFVPVTDSFLSTPILPKYYWEKENFISFSNSPPIGSGAFYYATDGLPTAGTAELARNNHWYATENNGWQSHVDSIFYKKQLNENTAWLQVMLGEIDCMLGVPPETFVKTLPTTPNVVGFHQSNGFVYEFNLNQMTDALRMEVGGSLNAGSNSQLLLNDTIKTAISMAVDRDELIEDVLFGYGEWTTTLVPSQNPMHHDYTNPDAVDRLEARMMLYDAGWQYDKTGYWYDIEDEDELSDFLEVTPLCNSTAGDSDPDGVLSFDFITLSTLQSWSVAAYMIIEWCDEVGVELNLDLLSVNEMNTAWYAADYDIWLWDWVFGPYYEAVSGVLIVLTTDAIGTDSDVYWSSPEYDALYDEAIQEMDFAARQKLVWEMQDLVYENRGCQALAFREDMYAFNTEDWTNFGDLNTSYYLLPDIWPTWLAMRMDPTNNAAPTINTADATPRPADVGETVDFLAVAVDDWASTPLEYRWFFGDGEKTVWSSSATAEHVYTADGHYTATVAVREAGPSGTDGAFDDYFMSYREVDFDVYDMSNTAPYGPSIEFTPADPDTGIEVQFTGSAEDDEEAELYYTWDFGDGSTGYGPSVTHQFTEESSWTVTLSVDDLHLGQGARPVTTQALVPVSANHAPSISVPDYGSVNVKQSKTYSVSGSDVDSRDTLRYTWDWGDGTISVTSSSSVSHSYSYKGTYTIRVFLDDLTDLDGHNVSDTGLVYVVNSKNAAPIIGDFTVSNDEPFTGEIITFYASASEPDGDGMTFTFEFDDGTSAEVYYGPTDPNEIVLCSVDKTYTSQGSYSVYLYVDDDSVSDVSDPISITVTANAAPHLEELDEVWGSTGVSTSFSADATDMEDDPLTYTWEWDDGTISVTSVGAATHTYSESEDYVYRVYVSDGKGHNVSDAAEAHINAIPVVTPRPDTSWEVDKARTFSVTATDADDDELIYTWDFDDGTVVSGTSPSVPHTYSVIGTYDVTVYVDDGFPLASHNVSDTAVITILVAGDYPPEIDPMADKYAAVGATVTFWADITDPNDDPMIITWDFGDGSSLEVGETVTHVYTVIDDYTFTVYADDGMFNVSDSATAFITADQPPVAVALAPASVSEDTEVDFDGSGSSDDVDIVSWDWEIVELSVSLSGEETSYTFDTPGTYTVELTVTDSTDQTDTDSVTIEVLDTTAPIAVADASETTIDMGDSVTLIGTDSSDNVGIVSYTWTFVYDGSLVTLTGVTADYTFEVPGVYTPTLTVKDDAGFSDTDTVMITVLDTESPVADAGEDASIDAGTEYTFDGSGSTDNTGVIDTYEWTFDDGGAQTLADVSPSYVFDNAGVFEVTLNVTDEAGNAATDTVTITVLADNAAPVADAGADESIVAGTVYAFDGTGSSDDVAVETYTWTFVYNGVAQELTGAEPTFTFGIAGAYIVTLNVTDAEDLYDTDTVTITVTPATAALAADAAVTPSTTVTVGDTVTFSAAGSTGAIVNYTWTFTYDGATVTRYTSSFTFVFDIEGSYTATLTVADADGETATDSVTVTVEADSEKTFIEQYGLPIGVLAVLVIVALLAIMLMKRGKGGKSSGANDSGVDGIASEEPAPPEDQNL